MTTEQQSSRFDVVSLGESMLRLSVPSGERLENATRLDVYPAGAEANVRVNGAPMDLTSRILHDGDEILLGDAETDSWRRYCFSTTDAQTLQFRPLERRTETLDGAF